MPLLGSAEDLTDQQKERLELIKKRQKAAANQHKDLDPRFDTWYGLSRNYRKLQRNHAQAVDQRDRDSVMQDFVRVFGEDLFIPWIFTTIETILPRILATDPTIAVKPNDEEEATLLACEPVKRLFERDQADMAYEMKLQETVRSGLRYGLGVQKLYWESKYRGGRDIVPNESKPGYKVVNKDRIKVYEGPMAESVDIRDFFWDPVGHDLASCGYVIHRTWRTIEYIEDRVTEGRERRERGEDGGWEDLDLEKIRGLSSKTARGEVWQERMQASGMSSYQTEGDELFEVWEYHDRDKVCTVLGKDLLVQEADNPFLHGDFPFQIYRPTLVEGEFVGIGAAEPIAHLQYEANTMRGQRRDAATLALSPPFFYSRGLLNPKNISWGAGIFNPVDGDPKDVLYQPQIRDLPLSGVSEYESLKGDIEMTTGVSETVMGAAGDETATGRQLSMQAAGQRIKQQVKNLHVDLLRPATKQKRELYRLNYTQEEQTQTIRVEDRSTPTGYAFVQCGPEHLNANIEVEPVDGSTEPENEVQKRADAVQTVDALGPFMEDLDRPKVLKKLLRDLGFEHPDDLLKPPGPTVEQTIEAIGKTLQEEGMPEEAIQELLQVALQRLQQEPEPEGPEENSASQNGAAPEPEPVAAGG